MKASFEKTMIKVDKKLGIGCLLETACLFVALAGILLTIMLVLMAPTFFSANSVEANSMSSSPSTSAVVVSIAK